MSESKIVVSLLSVLSLLLSGIAISTILPIERVKMPEIGTPALAFLILAGTFLIVFAMASVAFHCCKYDEKK